MRPNFKKKKKEESYWIREIAYIMLKNPPGPFTKMQLATELKLIHPDLSIQELKIEISGAFLDDKAFNKPPRFKVVRPQVWDLRERKPAD